MIAIAGASGSGKSSLARQTKDQLGDWYKVAAVAEDDYYRSQTDLTMEQRQKTNYDHPDAIDETLLVEHLSLLKAGGNVDQNWLILRNGSTTIGLFQGMLEQNIMTFNPGWNELAEPLEQFEDVREIQSRLKARGVELTTEAEEDGNGPASFTLVDPDGNHILIDQHVPKAQ